MTVSGDLRLSAARWQSLGWPRSGEEISYPAAKINQGAGDDRADALKDKQAGAGIDVCVGLALERETECDKKHQCDCEVF